MTGRTGKRHLKRRSLCRASRKGESSFFLSFRCCCSCYFSFAFLVNFSRSLLSNRSVHPLQEGNHLHSAARESGEQKRFFFEVFLFFPFHSFSISFLRNVHLSSLRESRSNLLQRLRARRAQPHGASRGHAYPRRRLLQLAIGEEEIWE